MANRISNYLLARSTEEPSQPTAPRSGWRSSSSVRVEERPTWHRTFDLAQLWPSIGPTSACRHRRRLLERFSPARSDQQRVGHDLVGDPSKKEEFPARGAGVVPQQEWRREVGQILRWVASAYGLTCTDRYVGLDLPACGARLRCSGYRPRRCGPMRAGPAHVGERATAVSARVTRRRRLSSDVCTSRAARSTQ